MCKGKTVKLACGHNLIHYTSRCGEQCDIPTGETEFIQDSCSECHILPDLIRKRYEKLQEETQKEYRQAHREGRFEDLHEIERCMKARRVDEFQELSEARKRVRSCPQVIWPGCRDDDQYVARGLYEDWSFMVKKKEDPRKIT